MAFNTWMSPTAGNSNSEATSSFGGSSTAEYLENLARRLIGLIRSRDWSHPDWHVYVAENFQAYAPDAFLEELSAPTTSTRDAYIAGYKAFVEAYPDYDPNPVSINADVDEREGTAKVWIIMSVAGHPPTIHKESVTILHWIRVEDRWIVVKQVGLRGFPAYRNL